jgi:hypothetical protein
MFRNWRIGTFNGALLAAYFIPAWTLVAFSIMVAPVHGLYERPSVAVALFISDHLQMSGMSTVRAAWFLALGRLTVVAFFALFLLQSVVAGIRKTDGGNEALGIALLIGSVISFASMLMASKVGETAALKLHATELLMLLTAVVVLVIERPDATPQAESTASVRHDEAQLLPNS